MSGMKQHDVGVTTAPGPDEPVVSRSDKVHLNIPTVMITKTASESLLRLIDASSEDVIRVRIDLTSSPSMTNTVYMGRETYPKLRVSQQVVHAIGDGLWAVVISATGNGEWQLYIMGAADAAMSMATTPWIVATPGKQLVSTSFAASMSALQVYGDMTLMKCPTRLHIDADQRPVITKPTT